MSRIHIKFKRKFHRQHQAAYTVISPDFSEFGTTNEIIGELSLDVAEGTFSYTPSDSLKNTFCPPEYFEKYAGDTEKVRRACQDDGFLGTAWSYYIYRRAKQFIESKDLVEEANTGV